MSLPAAPQQSDTDADMDEGTGLLEILTIWIANRRLLLMGPIAAGAVALAITYLIAPTFTAKTTFLPPQQQQSSTGAALASLGALAGLAGGNFGAKTTADLYVSLMGSENVEDRIIDRFKLMNIYKSKYRFEARKSLEKNVQIALGKKDGLITVNVDAKDPQMAADIANQYVVELKRMTSGLAITEAQQRRIFFEVELKRAKVALDEAQAALQNSGFNPGVIRAEPKAAADAYASLKAQATAAEVRLATMRRGLADTAPEVQQQRTLLSALREQLSHLEDATGSSNDGNYLGRYREYKYEEALYEEFSKQYEIARLDEARDGAPVQVIDPATPPEHKSKPQRAMTAIGASLGMLLVLMLGTLVHHFWQKARQDPTRAEELERLRAAWK